MLSLVQVVEWRASANPGQIALTDDRGAELTYAGLRTAMEASAAAFAVPELPRNATGKVTRAALREPYRARRDRRVS